eukprot:scaffold112179_cov19-Tisochrysis_lutea.AAC.1
MHQQESLFKTCKHRPLYDLLSSCSKITMYFGRRPSSRTIQQQKVVAFGQDITKVAACLQQQLLVCLRHCLQEAGSEQIGNPTGGIKHPCSACAAPLNDLNQTLLVLLVCLLSVVEAGVRNLKKQLEKVYRKAALRIVKDGSVSVWPVQ